MLAIITPPIVATVTYIIFCSVVGWDVYPFFFTETKNTSVADIFGLLISVTSISIPILITYSFDFSYKSKDIKQELYESVRSNLSRLGIASENLDVLEADLAGQKIMAEVTNAKKYLNFVDELNMLIQNVINGKFGHFKKESLTLLIETELNQNIFKELFEKESDKKTIKFFLYQFAILLIIGIIDVLLRYYNAKYNFSNIPRLEFVFIVYIISANIVCYWCIIKWVKQKSEITRIVFSKTNLICQHLKSECVNAANRKTASFVSNTK